jgi:hypothetical protein
MHPAIACAIALSVNIHSGALVVEHAAFDDRIAWVLPPDRLAAFARGGVVIDEDVKTMVVMHAFASDVPHGMTTFRGTMFKQTTDVPRHRTNAATTDLVETVTPRNTDLPAHPTDVEQAGMVDLPVGRLCVGQTWVTRLPVVTTLGSGTATVQHRIAGVRDGLVEVDVTGKGVISGLEYNLPRLLPGSISFHGAGWYDPATGAISQESYLIQDRLLRTVKAKTIGFIETETVDVTEYVSPPAAQERR